MPADLLHTSRPLREAYQLDLALFVAFEEEAAQLAGSIAQRTGNEDLRDLLQGQARDDQRHAARFAGLLDASLSADEGPSTQALLLRVLQGGAPGKGALRREEVVKAAVVPPLRHFFDRCRLSAEAGEEVAALVLLELVLKGSILPLYAIEPDYWRPVDPGFAALIEEFGTEEAAHVRSGVEWLRRHAASSAEAAWPALAGALPPFRQAFRYYARKLVAIFAALVRQHPDTFAAGRVCLPEDEQLAHILSASDTSLWQLLLEAGLPAHGLQESLSHA